MQARQINLLSISSLLIIFITCLLFGLNLQADEQRLNTHNEASNETKNKAKSETQIQQCVTKGKWLLPDSGKTISTEQYLPNLYNKNVILLGEHHANQSHHDWQLLLLKKLHSKNPHIVIGLEMFPRRKQALLDKWINKDIDQNEFIKASEWDEIWAFDFNQYLPLLTFAREKGIPLVAINVDKSLLKMVGKHGWENIPQQHRLGIGDPAKPGKSYVRQLATSFQGHYEDPSKISKQAFLRFVQQQLLWDRAMAEGLAAARKNSPDKQIVGIVGSWHIINGHGIPHQLKSLGINDSLSLVPWDEHLNCSSINQEFADAIYGPPDYEAVTISSD